MTARRQWIVITALGCLLVLVVGFLLLVRPARTKAASVRTSTAAETSQIGSLRAQLAQLQEERRDLSGEQAELAKIARQLPTTPQLPSTLRVLDEAARVTGVQMQNVAPGTPVAFSATAVTPLTKGTPAAGGTVTPTPTPTAASTASAAGTTVAGLAQVPLVLSVSGDFFQLESFLDKLEGLQRSMLVDTFTLSYANTKSTGSVPVIGAGELSATINTRVFESTVALGVPATPSVSSSGAAATTPGA